MVFVVPSSRLPWEGEGQRSSASSFSDLLSSRDWSGQLYESLDHASSSAFSRDGLSSNTLSDNSNNGDSDTLHDRLFRRHHNSDDDSNYYHNNYNHAQNHAFNQRDPGRDRRAADFDKEWQEKSSFGI